MDTSVEEELLKGESGEDKEKLQEAFNLIKNKKKRTMESIAAGAHLLSDSDPIERELKKQLQPEISNKRPASTISSKVREEVAEIEESLKKAKQKTDAAVAAASRTAAGGDKPAAGGGGRNGKPRSG